jgi:cobalt-zinc-cadmium efflux system outer membrane protein
MVVAAAQDPAVDLTTARRLAVEGHPEVTAAVAQVEAARARVRSARLFPYNPELEVESGDRRDGLGSSSDRGVTLAQELEVGGQRGFRIAAAQSDLAAAQARLEHRRRETRAAVDRAFYETVAAREERSLAVAEQALADRLQALEERRLELGEGTAIDLLSARAAALRSALRRQEAEARWQVARAVLARAIGADPERPPVAAGDLPATGARPELPPLPQLTDRALTGRSDLAALHFELVERERRIRLERARGVPNLRLAAFSRREEGAEITGGALSIALPLFDRNQGATAEAQADRDRLAAEVAAAELAVRQEVSVAHARYQAAVRGVGVLAEGVVGSLEETLRLLERSLEEGKIGVVQVLVLRRELFEARRELIEARRELAVAATELELATGGGWSGAAGEVGHEG